MSQLAQLTPPFEGKTQQRMQVLGIDDLDHHGAHSKLRSMRRDLPRNVEELDEKLHDIVRMTGGRLSFLGKVSRAADMEESAKEIVKHEKVWLQSHIGLIPDHDDDVTDHVRESRGCSMLLTHVCSVAKMVVKFLATVAGVCQGATGGRKGAGCSNCEWKDCV